MSKTKTNAKDKAINKSLGILSDQRGEYRVTDRYVDTWSGAHAGYCVQAGRENWDGAGPTAKRVVSGDAVYLHDLGTEQAYVALAWHIYREGAAALGIKLR